MIDWTMKEQTAVAMAPTAAAVGDAEPALACLFDEMAHGLMLATGRGCLLHANHAAQAELGSARALALRHGRVHATSNDEDRALHDLLTKAADDGKRGFMTLRGDAAHAVSVAVVPVRNANAVAQVALVLGRASVCGSTMLGAFARGHGLTPAESQVLGILCHGYSAPEVAQQLRVAVSTVRSHIRSLCGKTASNGVRELVTRIAVLPPMAQHEATPVH